MRTVVFLFLVSACAGANTGRVPQHLQASWDRCHHAVESHCHAHSHGNPADESRCEREIAEEYSRSQSPDVLRSRGCTAP